MYQKEQLQWHVEHVRRLLPPALNICLYLRWPAQPLWGSLSPRLSHWRWPHDVPEAPGTAGYSGTQKPWGEQQSEFHIHCAVKEQDLNQYCLLEEVNSLLLLFSWRRTCRQDGTRGSGRRRGRPRSERGHSPPQHCWGALQHGRTFLSSGPVSACRGQYKNKKKKTFTKGLLICSVCADGSNWDIKTELK